MTIDFIKITNFRNIENLELEFGDKFNILIGPNGSGKTSILEAIYHLSLGRSFKSNHYEHIIKHGAQSFCIYSLISQTPVGIERHLDGTFYAKVARQNIRTVSELLDHFPVQIITPDSHKIISEGPAYRRRFFDWGVFHVEHNFLYNWKRITKVIRQRNEALKLGLSKDHMAAWNSQFAELAPLINKPRMLFIEEFNKILNQNLDDFLNVRGINISYSSGCGAEDDLFAKIIDTNYEKELKAGHTINGPHRADFKIHCGNHLAKDILSRGQQKLLFCLFSLTQAQIIKNKTGKKAIFLIDDLYSELDSINRNKFLKKIMGLDTQVFITGTDYCAIEESIAKKDIIKLFHVEHGHADNML